MAIIVQPSIAGAKARDKQLATQGTHPITDQSKIPKMAPRRNLKTNKGGISDNAQRTKNAVQNLLNKSAKVSTSFTCSFVCMMITTYTNIVNMHQIIPNIWTSSSAMKSKRGDSLKVAVVTGKKIV